MNDYEFKGTTIDPNLLSFFDVTTEGKVVSAEVWESLWRLVIGKVNTIAEFCTKISELSVNWGQTTKTINNALADFTEKYSALSDSFVHYGTTEPTNVHTKFWLEPIEEDGDSNVLVTQAEFKKAVFPNFEDTTLTIDLTKTFAWKKSSDYLVESVHAVNNIDTIKVVYNTAGSYLIGGKTNIIPAGANINIVYTCKTFGTSTTPYSVKVKVLLDTPWIEVPSDWTYGGATSVKSGELVINCITSERPTINFYEYSRVSSDGTIVSPSADFAEVGEWKDGNSSAEDRVGYFVCIDTEEAGAHIRKATSMYDDVRGVTVAAPAFAGHSSPDKYGDDGKLLPQYSYVGVMGLVQVRDNGACVINQRCVVGAGGIAIPSDTDYGYHVVDRIDKNTILIVIEPNGDAVYRLNKDKPVVDLSSKQDKFAEVGIDSDCTYLSVDNILRLSGSHAMLDVGKGQMSVAAYDKISLTCGNDELLLKGALIGPDTPNVGHINVDGNRIRNLASPVLDSDAVNKAYLDNTIGTIETALDSIIAIQESLIGGNA